MSHARKVLFLSHDASRTGAPLLLLEIIKWLKANSSIEPEVLLKTGGELELEFKAVAPTRCLQQELGKLNRGSFHRVMRKLRLKKDRKLDLTAWYPPEVFPVVYANTIDTTVLAREFTGPTRQLIHHIHELGYCTEWYESTGTLKDAVGSTDAYIAVSRAVKDFLLQSIGVPSSKIHVIHGFPIANGSNSDLHAARARLRQDMGIPEQAFVIGMCGHPQWRKGTDLFVQLALQMHRATGKHEYHLLWLGGDSSSQREALHDVSQLGLQPVCHFIPAVKDPGAYFNVFDVFALTSREDPFSLAMLEAAMTGLPIVCFAGGGGAPELVGDDAGIIVPYLDVPAMAMACVELMHDEARRLELGGNARDKVLANYRLQNQGPKILALIEEQMNGE